jgi:DNA end-binding protein Ku
VQDKLKELIESKRKSGKATLKKEDAGEPDGPGASNVVDLMSALKKSVEKSARGKK